MRPGRCSCFFCLQGKRRLCVWEPAKGLALDARTEPAWKTALDWTLTVLFALALVLAQLVLR